MVTFYHLKGPLANGFLTGVSRPPPFTCQQNIIFLIKEICLKNKSRECDMCSSEASFDHLLYPVRDEGPLSQHQADVSKCRRGNGCFARMHGAASAQEKVVVSRCWIARMLRSECLYSLPPSALT